MANTRFSQDKDEGKYDRDGGMDGRDGGGVVGNEGVPAYPEGQVDSTGEFYDPYGGTPKLGMVRVCGFYTSCLRYLGLTNSPYRLL